MEEVPCNVTVPVLVVNIAEAPLKRIPAWLVAPIPLAVKFIAVNPAAALVFVMAELRTIYESAVRVSV